MKYKIFVILISLIASIYCLINNLNFMSKIDINDDKFIGTIDSYNIDKSKISFIIKGKEKIVANYYFKSTNEYKNIKDKIKLGKKIIVYGNFYIPNNNTIPNNFNYKKYLKSKKINLIMNTNKLKIFGKPNFFYDIKNYLINRINKYKYKEYYYTFILGDKSYFEDEIYNIYKTNGITHLFAISGMHISLIIYILSKLKIKKYFTYMFLIFYSFLVMFTPSVLRVVIFYILKSNNVFKNFSNSLLLILDLSIILFINPFLINDAGLLYSFIITYGLFLSKPKNFLYLSFYCFLLSIPITIFYNYEINIFSIIVNLLVVPFVSFLLYPSIIISLFFKFIMPFISFLIVCLEKVNLFLNCFKTIIIIGKINILIIIFLYIILFLFFNHKKFFIFLFFTILLIFKYSYILDNKMYITYFDVGQGDSILIYHKNISILIDTGGKINYSNVKSKDYYSPKIINYLKSKSITKIDYLIISHGDYDHMGESSSLVKKFKVKNVVFNCGTFNNLEYNLIEVLNEKNINYFSCISELDINNYKLKFLNTKEYNNENDNSNVIYLKYLKYKFLFMGDAGIKKEIDIINKYNLNNIDFIKIGHHGSNTSSENAFINMIKPKYSLISVGAHNRYGHPKDEVLDTLKNSKIYRTDLDGSIEIKLNKNGYKIRTCPP